MIRKFFLCQSPAALLFSGTAFLRAECKAWVTCTIHKAAWAEHFSEAVDFKASVILLMLTKWSQFWALLKTPMDLLFVYLHKKMKKNIIEEKHTVKSEDSLRNNFITALFVKKWQKWQNIPGPLGLNPERIWGEGVSVMWHFHFFRCRFFLGENI